MFEDFDFLNNLNTQQREVCITSKNVVLTACPGSGKTRTILYRLAYLDKKYSESRLMNIAITYTNRAANEIEDRLDMMDINAASIWVGTIHKFCMRFIIRPYAMYSYDLKNGYHVIDEFVKKEYCIGIANRLRINTGYKDPLSFPAIKQEYVKLLRANKEIDFDMILDYSIELLEKCPFIAENIATVIRSIQVDEYQDTNEKQYLLLKLIADRNPRINVLFVGDVNQAIYSSLGGIAKSRDNLEREFRKSFDEMCLSGSYRSTQRLIDYYCNFEVLHTGAAAVSELKNEIGTIAYDKNIHKNDLSLKIANVIKDELREGVNANEICVIAPQWYQIFPMAVQLRKHLPDISFDAPDISPFKYDPMNPFYLLSRLVYSEAGENSKRRKKLVNEIIDIFHSEYRVEKPDGFDAHDFLKIVNSVSRTFEDGIDVFKAVKDIIFAKFNVNSDEDNELNIAYNLFLKKVYKRIEDNTLPHTYKDLCNYFKERKGVVITTIHGVKGEEYHTVIGFDLLNMHLPHSSYIYEYDKKPYREVTTKKLLYVLCSRAKKNLYLFSERGRTTKKGTELSATDELSKVTFSYD